MNRGAQLLLQEAPERGDQIRLARDLEIDQGYMSRVMRAVVVPGLRIRILFEDRFGIPLRAWDEPALEAGDEPGTTAETPDAKGAA